MDERTREALEKSIKHWEENVAAETPEQARTAAADCALCEAFCIRPRSSAACVGCPVYEATGEILCGDTPYNRADLALNTWVHSTGYGGEAAADARESWRKAAQAELDFLKSLRPREEKTDE